MDRVQGDFAYDINTGQVTGVAPGRRQYLDPEIAGEGTKVIHSDGSTVNFNPPPVQAAIFDYSKVKSLQKYFNRTDFQFFPTWVYHPDGRSEIAKNAEECGAKYGIFLKHRTAEEKAKYGGGDYRWEFDDRSEWRPVPFGPKKFDPDNPDTGKIYVPRAPDPKIAEHELIAKVVSAMQGGQNDFLLKLLAAMQTTAATQPVAEEPKTEAPELGQSPKRRIKRTVDQEGEENDRNLWRTSAETIGIKVDNRWSVKRLKEEIAKATGNEAFLEQEATMDMSEAE